MRATSNTQTEPIVAIREAASDLTCISRNPAAGFWTYETADGRRTWGSGFDYTGDVTLGSTRPPRRPRCRRGPASVGQATPH